MIKFILFMEQFLNFLFEPAKFICVFCIGSFSMDDIPKEVKCEKIPSFSPKFLEIFLKLPVNIF